MLLQFRFITFVVFLSFAGFIQAQEPAQHSAAQKLFELEQSLSAETRERIASVRAADTVWCGLLDKEGALWFGSNNGVFRFDGTTFLNYSTKDGLCNNQVFSIMEDKEGILWFGTANGLCRYDRTTFLHVPIPWGNISGPWLDKVYPIVNPNGVLCMVQDRSGTFWLGTSGAGAYSYDGETFVSYLSNEGWEYVDGLHNNIITSILEDASGNIWFTSISHGGVSRFDGKRFTHYAMNDGLSDDMIRTSYEDRDGILWFGTHGKHAESGERDGGLDFYDGNSFGQLSQKDGLLRGHVVGIYEDKNGFLWLGRGVGSMCIYDKKTFAPFVSEDGQSFDGVQFIMEDAEGHIWFGGKKGKLLRYDGESVVDFSRKGS